MFLTRERRLTFSADCDVVGPSLLPWTENEFLCKNCAKQLRHERTAIVQRKYFSINVIFVQHESILVKMLQKKII